MNKRGMDMPFSWIFAIIAGSLILFLAIYAASQFIDTSKYRQYTETAKSITILTDPLETGVKSNIGDVIGFRQETKTKYGCYEPAFDDVFGKQTIAFSEQSGLGKKWGEFGGEIAIRNKFIFADEVEQGKNLYLFSKPFFMGFKVSDLIEISTEKYCFVNPPEIIEEDFGGLSALKNVNISAKVSDCSRDSKTVCFNNQFDDCDIKIYDDNNGFKTGYTDKKGEMNMHFAGSLIYSTIFSSSDIYECNVKRLGAKISALAQVYADKAEIVKLKNCNSLIEEDLKLLSEFAAAMNSSADLAAVYMLAEQMDSKNEDANCKLYTGE